MHPCSAASPLRSGPPESENVHSVDGDTRGAAGTVAGVAPAAPPRLRVFIVEDNALIRERLVKTLEERAHVQVVGTAADEWTATQWMNDPTHVFDLGIVDIFLNKGSGLGVLRKVAANHPPHHLVVLSNYTSDAIRAKCLELGAAAVLDKSNDLDALLQVCHRLAHHAQGPGDAPAA
jgi:DNA-binding NarL/FixJ family response regulator